MSEVAVRIDSMAEHLRRTFDHAFTQPRQHEAEPMVALLAIRVGDDPYAIRLNAIAGLFADRTVTPLPGPVTELLGLAGFRGALFPVYDLRSLLGYSAGGTPRWLILAGMEARIALAFDRFEGHLLLPHAALTSTDPTHAARQHVGEIARTADMVRPIIHLPSLFDVITSRTRHGLAHPRSTTP